MTPEQYQRLKQLFMEAVQLDDAHRAAFLEKACAGDADLRRQIDSLLQHHRPETVIEADNAGQQPSGRVVVQGDGTSPASAGAIPTGQSGHEFLPGAIVAERYRIAGLLGRGGMGEVYRADDMRLDQVVALKFLLLGRASDPVWLARFHNEVRIARKVTHPNVCRVYDIGETAGQVFISMQYIDGEDLGSLLRRIGRLPNDKVLQVARQLCAGLGAAHDQGVLHRDLKPANIMIDGLGQALITDFGIAALVPAPGERTAVAGTPGYMAPELLAGQAPSRRSDIYSLGVVLYQMVTGRRPFAGDTPEQRLKGAQPPPGRFADSLDPGFEEIILRCLEQDPDRRPPSVYAVAAALPGGDPLAAALALGHTPSPDTVANAWDTGPRLPGTLALSVAALLGLLAAVLLAGHTFFVSHGGLGRAPAVLEDKAQDAIAAIGQTVPAGRSSYRFVIDPAGPPDSIGRHESAPQAHVVFEYRKGERWVPAPGPLVMSTLFDVSWPAPGSEVLRMAMDGRLLSYTAFPEPAVVPHPGHQAPDWSVPFRMAGLQPEAFRPVLPVRRPPMYADTVAAWEQPAADEGSTPIRVEAAAIGSQVTYFVVIEPERTVDHRSLRASLAPVVRWALFMVLLAGGSGLALRSLRSGRADRRGGWRLAAFLFCLQGMVWTVAVRHTASFTTEAGLIVSILRSILFTAAVAWVFYIGIEPQVRRLWPQSIISWSRVLLGRFRDPLVVRDLAAGVAAGIAMVLLREVGVLVAHSAGWETAWLVMPDFDADLGTLTGFGYAVEVVGRALFLGIWTGLGLMLLMLLLRLALRSAWLTDIAFVVVGTAIMTSVSNSVQSLPWLTNGLTLLVLTGVLSRVGLLAGILALFSTLLLTSLPLTLDVHAWYADLTGLAVSILGGLLAFGVFTSMFKAGTTGV